METKGSSWISAIAMIGGLCAVCAGVLVRDRMDLGKNVPAVVSTPGTLVASRETGKSDQLVDIPESQYFQQLSMLVKELYVDPMNDDQKLALGAIKGMINSLEDPQTIYFEKDVFAAIQSARNGKVQGVGVDLMLKMPATAAKKPGGSGEDESAVDSAPIPSLVVVSVAPGSPADKAGVMPGDEVDSVQGHWVLSPDLINEFRKVSEDVAKGRAKAETLKRLRSELRKKMDGSLMPMRAYQMLRTGTDGTIAVEWRRGGALRATEMTKTTTVIDPVSVEGDRYVVRLVSGVGDALRSKLPSTGTIDLDLRHNADADPARLSEVVEAILPVGTYGTLVPERSKATGTALKTKRGVAGASRKFVVQVDETSRGVASALASILKKYAGAEIRGVPNPDLRLTEYVELPDGSGFTLARFKYQTSVTK